MGDPVDKKIKRKIRRRFFIRSSRFRQSPDENPVVSLDRDTVHHIRNVLRISEGSFVVLFDGSGKEYEGEIVLSKPSEIMVHIKNVTTPRVESPLEITVAQALIKGNTFDRVLTLCTELGAARFVPLFTARTVVKINKAQAADRVSRWEKIVQEACAQCGRVKPPKVEMPVDLKPFLVGKHQGLRIILYERGGSGQLRLMFDHGKPESVVVLAGPEGGFEQGEVKLAMDSGFNIWGLGPRILRAENAASIAIAMLGYELGDMG